MEETRANAGSDISQTGRLIVCSGQRFASVRSADLSTRDVQAQASELMKNLGDLLASRGSGFEHVVKGTIYLTDLEDAGRVLNVYGCFFDGIAEPPASTTVKVDELPGGVKVDIELIALI